MRVTVRDSCKGICAVGYVGISLEDTIARNFILKRTQFGFFVSIAEYKILCPGGEGFRPNPITVILEGNSVSFLRKSIHFELPWVY